MLIKDYWFNDYNEDIWYGCTFEENYFFIEKKKEFINMYQINNLKLPNKLFKKKLRYKNFLDNNHFVTFSKMLIKRGLLSKFRLFFLKFIYNWYWDNNFSHKYEFHNLLWVLNNYWCYTLNELLYVEPVFKLTFHRLDKNVRKYNRKRKLKITYKYNFIPKFKRTQWNIRLICKFIKFGSNLKFYDNFNSLLRGVILNKNKCIFSKLNIFTFNKIKNFSYQKTLLNSI